MIRTQIGQFHCNKTNQPNLKAIFSACSFGRGLMLTCTKRKVLLIRC
jgi:hypothetical protein